MQRTNYHKIVVIRNRYKNHQWLIYIYIFSWSYWLSQAETNLRICILPFINLCKRDRCSFDTRARTRKHRGDDAGRPRYRTYNELIGIVRFLVSKRNRVSYEGTLATLRMSSSFSAFLGPLRTVGHMTIWRPDEFARAYILHPPLEKKTTAFIIVCYTLINRIT